MITGFSSFLEFRDFARNYANGHNELCLIGNDDLNTFVSLELDGINGRFLAMVENNELSDYLVSRQLDINSTLWSIWDFCTVTMYDVIFSITELK